jgi:hypothetical protein
MRETQSPGDPVAREVMRRLQTRCPEALERLTTGVEVRL